MNIKNNVGLIGRLTADPVLNSKTSKPLVSFSIAVSRFYSGKNETDFINCKAWDATATFISKYFKKGNLIGVMGELRTSTYEQNGKKITQVFVNVDNASFVSDKAPEKSSGSKDSSLEDGVPGEDDVLSVVGYEESGGSTLDISSDDLPF